MKSVMHPILLKPKASALKAVQWSGTNTKAISDDLKSKGVLHGYSDPGNDKTIRIKTTGGWANMHIGDYLVEMNVDNQFSHIIMSEAEFMNYWQIYKEETIPVVNVPADRSKAIDMMRRAATVINTGTTSLVDQNFSNALSYCKMGRSIRRAYWKGRLVWVPTCKVKREDLPVELEKTGKVMSVVTLDGYLCFVSEDGFKASVGWTPRSADIGANDWIVI